LSTLGTVKAVMLEVDERMLEERRRLGHDRWDEMWEGVLHMVPPAGGPHQGLGTNLLVVIVPLAKRRGLVARYETGLFRPAVDDDYRVPDLLVTGPERLVQRGVDGAAELVVEILSDNDESYAKLDWYAALGVREMLILDPATLAVELYRGSPQGPVRAPPGPDGSVRCEVLEAGLVTIAGAIRVDWEGGEADVTTT
jgi:Uma2 family endonuclease